MYNLDIRPTLKKNLIKLGARYPKQAESIVKKSEEIVIDHNRYKNLRVPLNHWKRVHIDKTFCFDFFY